nr:RNA-binding protein [Bacillaceae bacterium]
MRKEDPADLTGRVVKIRQGKDKGQYAIVIKQLDSRTVLIADGEKRTFSRPKKKNLMHLRLCSYVSPEVRNSLNETGQVTNGKLRHALIQFRLKHLTEEEGDDNDGERRCH